MLLAVTPLPRPLTTPPVTSTYFIAAGAADVVLLYAADFESRVPTPAQRLCTDSCVYLLFLLFMATCSRSSNKDAPAGSCSAPAEYCRCDQPDIDSVNAFIKQPSALAAQATRGSEGSEVQLAIQCTSSR